MIDVSSKYVIQVAPAATLARTKQRLAMFLTAIVAAGSVLLLLLLLLLLVLLLLPLLLL